MDISTLISAILKAFGVKVKPEHVTALEEMIPQIPGKIVEYANGINAAMVSADQRLAAIEKRLGKIEDFERGAHREKCAICGCSIDGNLGA